MNGFARAYSALAIGAAASLLVLYYPFTAEDAWIVLRYARNAAEHGELTFNRGEFINALTSPLDALIRIVLHKATADPLTAHKGMAVLYSAGTLVLGAAKLRRGPAGQAAYLGLVALSAPFALWTMGGLETPMLALIVTAFAVLLLDAPPRLLPAAALAGLAFLARHDSVLFTGPALLWAAVGRPLRDWIATGVCAAALPLAWMGFALAYYHDIFPTSLHIKAPGADPVSLGWNLVYLGDFGLQSGLAVVLGGGLVLGIALAGSKSLWAAITARGGLWLGLVLAVIVYGLLAATVHMMFGFRLFLPYLPVLALLGAELLARGITLVDAARARPLAIGVLALLAAQQAVLALTIERFALNPSRVGEYQYIGAAAYERNFIPTLAEAAAAIAADWPRRPGATTRRPRVLTFAAGRLPWDLPDADILEDLVAYRHACGPDRRRLALLADYIHLVTPWSGSLAAQLPRPPAGYDVVWQRTTEFDGGDQTWMVLFNPAPDAVRLPAYVDGPCRLPEP